MLAPFFRKRIAGPGGGDLGVNPAVPPGSGSESARSPNCAATEVAAAASADSKDQATRADSTWANLIEIKETEFESANVLADTQASCIKGRRRQAALALVLGSVAIFLPRPS